MKPLVVIPARGNSKGLPNKNIRQLNNKPMIVYTLEAAQRLFKNEQICVTTDSVSIADAVRINGYNVPFLRPEEFATDTASTRSVVLHALEEYKKVGELFSHVILLQPTSPLRTTQQITEAIALYDNRCDMVVSVKEAKSNPYFTLFEEDLDGFLTRSKVSNATRRQDAPRVWEFNGAIYIFAVDLIVEKEISAFRRLRKFVMDEESSVDIDTELDWVIAEYIMKKRESHGINRSI